MTCQSCTPPVRISFSKSATCSGGASGSSTPVQTSTLAFTCPGCAGILVASTPWKLTTAFRLAPSRASSSTTDPPKQNPIAASLPASTCGSAASAASPGTAAGTELFRRGTKPADQSCDLLQIARLLAIAEHVGGQRDIAKTGE